jgi:hypothetical protein
MTPIVDQPGNSRVTVTDPPNTNFSGTFTQGAAGSSGNYIQLLMTTTAKVSATSSASLKWAETRS